MKKGSEKQIENQMENQPERQLEKRLFDAVVFDLDGTLLDTLEDLRESVNYALDRMGFPRRSLEEVRRFVGNGVGETIRRAVPEATAPSETERCFSIFREYYNAHMNDTTRPYDGILPLLTGLSEAGCGLGVVSNKYDSAVKELCRIHFGSLIRAAVGERQGVRRKPAPDGLLSAIELLGAAPERTLYVGDSEVDVETAENAGVRLAAVCWGFREKDRLKRAGARCLAESPMQILDIVKGENGGKASLRSGD